MDGLIRVEISRWAGNKADIRVLFLGAQRLRLAKAGFGHRLLSFAQSSSD
jgi:hypothetical protein